MTARRYVVLDPGDVAVTFRNPDSGIYSTTLASSHSLPALICYLTGLPPD
jgi:hypothetical protein